MVRERGRERARQEGRGNMTSWHSIKGSLYSCATQRQTRPFHDFVGDAGDGHERAQTRGTSPRVAAFAVNQLVQKRAKRIFLPTLRVSTPTHPHMFDRLRSFRRKPVRWHRHGIAKGTTVHGGTCPSWRLTCSNTDGLGSAIQYSELERDEGLVVCIFIFTWAVVLHIFRIRVLGTAPEAVRVLPAQIVQYEREPVLRL